ncbi:MAG: ABC transporter permease [Lachnospiraceae bacterium]|nr:ABC transporter permease [Lachnospiraceae bacterium]
MRITAKLALNQIKRNRYRTLGAISAIILSTALTTAVFCFITSGNTMLVSFLGEGYGEYGGAYQSLLLVPAIVLGLLIFVMSVTVISNVFQSSANQRINEFGILKCVGGTTKQIRETVIYESIWLSIVGIPLGLVVGLGVGFLGVQITADFISELNDLQQSIIMRPISVSLSFNVTPIAFLCSAILSFFTVLYSAYKPAKKAGKITALSCIRGFGEVRMKDMKIKNRMWIRKSFGFEGILADRNLARNKTSFKPTIRALAIGILLILSAGSLLEQARQMQEYMDPGTRDIMMDYASSRIYRMNEVTGKEEEIILKPIHSSEAELVTQRLLEYGDIQIKGIGYDNCTYHAIISKDYLLSEMIEALGEDFGQEVELDVELMVLDKNNYAKVCEAAGVPEGSNILLNYYKYNDNGYMKHIVPFSESIEELSLQKANGEITMFSVDGFLPEEQVPSYVTALNEKPIRLIVPEAEVRFYDWFCHPEDEAAYTQHARMVSEEFFPTYTDDSYVEEGFTVRISREDTMVKVLNIAIVIAEIIIYGFVALLLLIGLVSVISTLSNNVMIRAREFAILKSVGMTTKGLKKMLICESVICTLRAVVWGVPLGILIPYVLNLAIRKVVPIIYEIPWLLLITSVGIIFFLILSVTFGAIHKLKKQNLIESIRMKTD